MSSDKKQNLQDIFLNAVRKGKTPLTVFLVNGVKLQALMSTQGWASPNVRALAEKSRALLPRSKATEHTVSKIGRAHV